MRTEDLTDEDEELIAAASEVLREHFAPNRHRCAAAIRTTTGAIYTGINLLPDVGIASVHAEQIALGRAVLAGDSKVETSVAVVFQSDDETNPIRVVSACGTCRELLHDFSPEARVIISRDGLRRKVPISDLLPA